MKIAMSICTFNNDDFEVMIRDKETGEELSFSGKQKVSSEELELINKIAPACVWTTYERTTPNDPEH